MQQQPFGFRRCHMVSDNTLMREPNVVAIHQRNVNARRIGSQNCLPEPFWHIVRFDARHTPFTARPVQQHIAF
ncbi:hypothetical protein D3C87_1769930 [compost metagenome]